MAKRKSRWENITRAGTIDSMSGELKLFPRINNTLDEFIEVSRSKFWSIPIIWNVNLKNTAGYFFESVVRTNKVNGTYPGQRNQYQWITDVDTSREHIELHPGLTFATDKQMNQVFLHEVAHAIQHHTEIKFRRQNHYYRFERSHGRIWYDVMISLGIPPLKTHRIPEALRKAAVHITPSGKVIDPSEGLTI